MVAFFKNSDSVIAAGEKMETDFFYIHSWRQISTEEDVWRR